MNSGFSCHRTRWELFKRVLQHRPTPHAALWLQPYICALIKIASAGITPQDLSLYPVNPYPRLSGVVTGFRRIKSQTEAYWYVTVSWVR